jgi:oligosaccharide reducing-end xylanase
MLGFSSVNRPRASRRPLLAALSGAVVLWAMVVPGCTSTTDSLGYDDLPASLDGGTAGSGGTAGGGGSPGSGGTENAGGDDDGGSDSSGGTGLVAGRGGADNAGKGGGGDAGKGGKGGGSGGSEPADGGDPGAGGAPDMPTLMPLAGRPSYPNPIGDLIGATEGEITERIEGAYQQLFHGEPAAEEPIYFVSEDDDTQAFIKDIFHNDIRTEGMGLAMLISVQLGKKEEFDKLWKYSKTHLLIPEGESYRAGYFDSFCDTETSKVTCADPYGMQQLAMSLIFAHNVWGSDGTHDYEADVLELLDVMLHKVERNGGPPPIDDVTNVFDTETFLVFDVPNTAAASYTRPSIEMPAYYELWAQATGNTFWSEAAVAARKFFGNVAHPITGLMPMRAYLDGNVHPDYANYNPEAYRVMLNLVLDQIWTGDDAWIVAECNKLITFFAPIPNPGTTYTLDGMVVLADPEKALLLVNGIAAAAADTNARVEFIRYVWETPLSTGEYRYYQGLLHLYGLLVLSGRMQIL